MTYFLLILGMSIIALLNLNEKPPKINLGAILAGLFPN
jgi:hypothetical protein